MENTINQCIENRGDDYYDPLDELKTSERYNGSYDRRVFA